MECCFFFGMKNSRFLLYFIWLHSNSSKNFGGKMKQNVATTYFLCYYYVSFTFYLSTTEHFLYSLANFLLLYSFLHLQIYSCELNPMYNVYKSIVSLIFFLLFLFLNFMTWRLCLLSQQVGVSEMKERMLILITEKKRKKRLPISIFTALGYVKWQYLIDLRDETYF